MVHALLCLVLLAPNAFAKPTRAERVAAEAQARALSAADIAARASVSGVRTTAEGAPTGSNTLSWLTVLLSHLEHQGMSYADRGVFTWEADAEAAVAAAEKVAAADPPLAADLLAKAAHLAWIYQKDDQVGALAERSVLDRPTQAGVQAYVSYWQMKDATQLAAKCQAARKAARTDIQRFVLLEGCAGASGADTVAAALAWASKEDRAWFEAELAAKQARAGARASQQQAQSEAMRASFTSSATPAPAAPGPVASSPSSSGPKNTSITAKITCTQNVRVFRGSTAGSGTYGWESPNSQVSYTVSDTQQICVCDGSDKRLSCWSPSGQDRATIEISCGGISAR